MLPQVGFPELVERYMPHFAQIFSPQAQVQFKRYLTGLMVSENKTIQGMNQLFVIEKRNQSSLNRFLTESPYSVENLNKARLAMLQTQPETRIKSKGVISVDDSLLSHVGKHFEQSSILFDHVSGQYVWAHNLVSLHYSDDQTDYPIYTQLWKPMDIDQIEAGLRRANIPLQSSKEKLKQSNPAKWRKYIIGVLQRRLKTHPELLELYDTKLEIAKQFARQWRLENPTSDAAITFDSWYTQPSLCEYLDKLGLGYVGTLKESQSVLLHKGPLSVGEFAQRLKEEHLQALKEGTQPVFQVTKIPYKGTEEVYYTYCKTHYIEGFGRQRLVISYRCSDLSDTPKFFISNRLCWQAAGIVRIRRHRWSIESFYQEAKAEGLDKYQLRNIRGIERHIAFVVVVYSLLRMAQYDFALHQQIGEQLHITPDSHHPAALRRIAQAMSLWHLIVLIQNSLAKDQSDESLISSLIQAICPS